MKRSLGIAGATLAVAVLAAPLLAGVAGAGSATYFGGSTPQPVSPPTTGLTVVGSGRVTVQPDRAYLTAGVQRTAPTAHAAQSATSRTMAAVSDKVKALPMVQNVRTVHVALHPQSPPPASGPGQSQPAGFVAEQALGLTVRDVHAVGRVLDAAVKAGANTQMGVSFGVSDASKARAQALADAVADGRQQAQQAAQAAGSTLKGLTAMVILPSSAGAPGLGGGGGGTPPVIQPGAIQVEVAVQMTFAY